MRAADVLRNRSFLSVVAPLHHGDMASMLSGLFISQLLFRAYDRYTHPGGVPLLLILDEAAELKNRVDFKSLLSVARAAQVAALLAVQDVTQFDDKSRSVVFGNCGTLIYLPGQPSTAPSTSPTSWASTPYRPHRPLWDRRPTDGETSAPNPGRPRWCPYSARARSDDLPFGRFAAVVHSRPMADRPFLVDLAAQP